MKGRTDDFDNELDGRLGQAVEAILAEPSPRDARRRLVDTAASWTPATIRVRPRRGWPPFAAIAVAASVLLAVGVGLYYATVMCRTREVAVSEGTKTGRAGESAPQRGAGEFGASVSARDNDGARGASVQAGTPRGRTRGMAGAVPKREHAAFAQSAPIMIAWSSAHNAGASVLHVVDWSRPTRSRLVKTLGVRSMLSESRVALSPDGRWLLRADGEILDLDTRKRTAIDLGWAKYEPRDHWAHGINNIGFSPDGGRVLVLVGGPPPKEGAMRRGTIRIFDFSAGRLLCEFPAGEAYKARIGFSPDGKQLVGADPTRHILRRDTTTGKIIKRYEPALDDQIYAVAISPDGRLVAASQRKGDMLLWEADTGRLAHRIHLVDTKGYAYRGLRFSPNGRLLAAKDRFRISVHDTATGRLVGKTKKEGQLRWSADGKTLTLVTEGKVGKGGDMVPPSVHQWDPESGKVRSPDAPAAPEGSTQGRSARPSKGNLAARGGLARGLGNAPGGNRDFPFLRPKDRLVRAWRHHKTIGKPEK